MKKILLSVLSIAAVGAVAFGATTAFFSDTETSSGNILEAGAIDLTVDNTCYYNEQACIGGYWNGEVRSGNECDCNWSLGDLEDQLFFELYDIKPGDREEDTISLHVENNDAWLCADVHLTSDEDNTCVDPELVDDPTCPSPSPLPGSGDLADEIRFIWWADDGDNVLEVGENTLPSGPLGVLDVSETATVALADSVTNIWEPGPPSPFPGTATRYIGKAWCFGTIAETPVTQDGYGAVDPEATGPDERGAGFTCDGEMVDNAAQTDSLTADISFRAVQARNNELFTCED